MNSFFQNMILVSACIIIFAGCQSKTFDENVTNLNRGELSLYADESYRTLVDELIKSYQNVYPESKISATYGTDAEIMQAMLNDKTRMIITGRKLSKNEIDAIEKTNEIKPEQFTIGTEAIAIISSANNGDSIFDLDEFKKSRKPGYSGKYSDTRFVFNKKNGSMVSEIIGESGNELVNMFSLDNADTLTSYVASNENVYGFIAFAEISDMDDPASQSLMEGIKVMQVSAIDSTGSIKNYSLSQSSIALNAYPLQRPVNIVRGNVSQLLGTGFVNFMYRDKAGRIILKAGLIPVKMPERQIRIVE